MTEFLRRFFFPKKRKATRKDSITGRNKTFPVPYLSRLEGNQLQPGQSLIVRGVVKGNDEFLINLTSGPCVELESENDRLDNRLLSIRCNIPKRKIFLNACVNGEWGKEASVRHDWKNGDEFDIRVRCLEEAFLIFIEHKLVAKFSHYIPMNNISHIYVNGEIDLYCVSWEGKHYQVPYSADIPGNLFPGRKLYLSGVARKDAKHISLDFAAAHDVAFKMNVNFKEKRTVRNACLDGKWGKEETTQEGKFPLKKKNEFDMLIYCEDKKFTVLVNDCYYISFEYRVPISIIDHITIEGDLDILGVHLK